MLANPKIKEFEDKFELSRLEEVASQNGMTVEELQTSLKKMLPRELETGIFCGDLRNNLTSKTFSFHGYCEKVGLRKAIRHDLFKLGEYGVADNIEQIKEHYKKLINYKTKKYCLELCLIVNDEQGGGFRWHKNGRYIGVHENRGEHLYESPEIKEVIVYHIWEILD